MENLIGLKFKWECNKCGNIIENEIKLTSDTRIIAIKPTDKCSCGTAHREYYLEDITVKHYTLREVKNETSAPETA